jgi:hypothetical protein
MKKILFVAFAMIAMTFASCGNSGKATETVNDSTVVDSIEVVDSTVVDSIEVADSIVAK